MTENGVRKIKNLRYKIGNYSAQFVLASPNGRVVAFWLCRLFD